MKRPLILLTILFQSLFLMAQEDLPEKNERIESFKIAFITQRLNLSTKEATVFWPVYNEFSQQMKSLRAKDRERSGMFRANMDPTDQESEKFISDNLTFRQQELDLTKKYMTEFRKVLPAAKVARLVTLDQEFKMQLLQQMKKQGGMR